MRNGSLINLAKNNRVQYFKCLLLNTLLINQLPLRLPLSVQVRSRGPSTKKDQRFIKQSQPNILHGTKDCGGTHTQTHSLLSGLDTAGQADHEFLIMN